MHARDIVECLWTGVGRIRAECLNLLKMCTGTGSFVVISVINAFKTHRLLNFLCGAIVSDIFSNNVIIVQYPVKIVLLKLLVLIYLCNRIVIPNNFKLKTQ